MIVFVDDSGDPGFKVGKGSSAVFVVALVIFDDPLDAEETALKIKKLRRTMKLKDEHEFRFNKCRQYFRCKFLSSVSDSKFRIRAIVMRKNKIYSPQLRTAKESFYRYTIKTVLKYSAGKISNAKIKLDGRGDRRFKKAFSIYLRRELNLSGDRVFKDLKFVDSKKNVLIQLADMVAVAIHRSYYSDKSDRNLYRNLILGRIENEWKFR
ncbi:MAG: DUF3800 domain-containing protein [Dehalococcoidia bacterium]|nr:DUF3800 domain-containing protein [Dehalococcoidia bacterium]|tara:strand:- start:1638 stop:2264 length:627 start_codon:yes stop_codon:yes gene_type:complete